MSKSSDANDSSTKALRQLEAQGLAFTSEAFVSEIIGRDLEKVAMFIEAGIDVNEAFDGMSPIVWLASQRRGSCEIAQLLIDNGADVNAVDQDGISAIRMAVFNAHKELLQLLIANGANLNAVDQDGLTELDMAVYHGRKELAQLLIENGAEPSPQTASEDVMSEKLEITNIVERLELLEEKFGIAISALFASCYYESYGTPPYHAVTINFDVTSLSGGKLECSFKISASAYNLAGQLLGTSSTYINNEEFIGFGPESILCHLDQAPAKIRLFPSV